MRLDNLDKLILDALCLDHKQNEIYLLLGIPKTTMTHRLSVLKEIFNVKTVTGLIFKYANYEK